MQECYSMAELLLASFEARSRSRALAVFGGDALKSEEGGKTRQRDSHTHTLHQGPVNMAQSNSSGGSLYTGSGSIAKSQTWPESQQKKRASPTLCTQERC